MALTYPLIMPAQGVRSITMRPRSIVARSTSPFTGQQQIQAHQGQWWEADVALPPMKQDGYADDIAAFLTGLNGIEGTFLLGDSSRKTPRGSIASYNGMPYFPGGTQSGMELIVEGLPASSNILKAGDYIQVGGENILLRSSDQSNASWSKVNVSISADSGSAPNGLMEADKITATATGGVSLQAFSADGGVDYVFSAWLRCASGTVAFSLLIIDTDGGTALASSAVTVTTSWTRYTVTAKTRRAGGHSVRLGGPTFVSGSEVFVWEAQVNKGVTPDPITRTTTAARSSTRRLYKATADAWSNGSGVCTINIWPRLRESPPVGDAPGFQDCKGTFRLASEPTWSVDPAKIYDIGFSAVEAI